MKIVCIGAGNAATVAALRLAKAGIDVSVYEKNTYENLSYDWHDDINPAAWQEYGLEPPKHTPFHKGNWSFLPPNEKSMTKLSLPEDKLDFSTERRLFAQQYVDLGKAAGADYHLGEPVDSLLIEGGKVKGIIVKGEKIYADLVIDNSGAMSKFRASLPDSYKITKMPDKTEVFHAYRSFNKMAEGVEPDKVNTNKAYLKHLGNDGISWSILDPSGTVNILIGRQGELTDKDFKEAYEALKQSNPWISDEVVRGGYKCFIPIRFPLTRMMGDGYIAIGDAAFMTIPMIGSGIENSMKAACELTDVIIKKQSVKKEDLWEFEVKYFEKRGGSHCGVDILKRWLLGAKPKDIDWLLNKGVVSAKNMADAATGHLIILSFPELLEKVAKGWTRMGLLLPMALMLNKTTKVAKIASKKIPKTFNEAAIDKWAAKVEKLVYGK